MLRRNTKQTRSGACCSRSVSDGGRDFTDATSSNTILVVMPHRMQKRFRPAAPQPSDHGRSPRRAMRCSRVRRTSRARRASHTERAVASPCDALTSSSAATCSVNSRFVASMVMESPSCTSASGPPSAASGVMWPTTKPWLPPEKRPSVISATLSPRPLPMIARGRAAASRACPGRRAALRSG